jgi:hypothetical protein
MIGTEIGKGIIAMRRLSTITAALFLVGISFHTQVDAQDEATMTTATPATFHVMAKPTGSRCNLHCAYCFYLKKEQRRKARVMQFNRSEQS